MKKTLTTLALPAVGGRYQRGQRAVRTWVVMAVSMAGIFGSHALRHDWYNSRLIARGIGVAYYNNCDSAWFYGSELSSLRTATGAAHNGNAITAYGGDIHVYGGSLRVVPEAGVSPSPLKAVYAKASEIDAEGNVLRRGEVHIHGTGIDVVANGASDIIALHSEAGMIHANESAYVLHSDGGAITRVRNDYVEYGGEIMAPYLWQTSALPPEIESETGFDIVVVTNTADNNPHMLVFKKNCSGSSNWFDMNTHTCF